MGSSASETRTLSRAHGRRATLDIDVVQPVCLQPVPMKTELTEEILSLQPGDHLCLFYDRDPGEQLPALASFMHQALQQDEQFIYVVDDQTVDTLSAALEKYGIPVSREIDRRR